MGEGDDEPGAAGGRGVDGDGAVVPGDDVAHDGQPESRAATFLVAAESSRVNVRRSEAGQPPSRPPQGADWNGSRGGLAVLQKASPARCR